MESGWYVSLDRETSRVLRVKVRDGCGKPGVGIIDRKINLALNYGSLESGWINIRN